jgi:ribonuclease P protein subunit RPR2
MNRDFTKKIALERVTALFQLARENIHERPDLAQRYVEVAGKIAMRTRLHLPMEYRLQVCRHCKRFILPGVGARIRVQPRRSPHVVVTCLYCGGTTRILLERKKPK